MMTTGRPADGRTATACELLAAALDYAGRGWHVLPLRAGDKSPAVPDHTADRCAGTDPWCRSGHAGWQARATTDPARITRWWCSPLGAKSGVGIATGPSGLLVVDTDRPAVAGRPAPEGVGPGVIDGEAVLASLADEHGEQLPATFTVTTRSGGRHRYYSAPAATQLGNTAGALGWLVDTRGEGGYVVAPPTTVAGRCWTVADDRPVAPLPRWLAALLERPSGRRTDPRRRVAPAGITHSCADRYVEAAVAAEVRRVKAAPAGRRNHTLFTAAVALGQLVGGSALHPGAAAAALSAAAAAHVDAGAYSAGQAQATIRSGLTRGRREPRTA
jgi:hypothetical protein